MESTIYQTVDQIGISLKNINKIIFFVFKKEGVVGDLSLHFIGDKRMRTLNSLHRNKKTTTDVLSFASRENESRYDSREELGDIFIDVPHIKRQARAWNENFETEMVRMIIHGILHILGYDHMKKNDAKIMFAKQENYLKECEKLL